jgi:hypothetical protein
MHTRLALVLFAGCANAHTPGALETGVYDLMIEVDVESCAPARPTGAMGPVGVIVDGDAIDAPVPDDAGDPTSAHIVFTPERSFFVETDRDITSCDGAWASEVWSVTDADNDSFEISHLQTWFGVESCVGASEAPATDCRSERRFRYTLRTPCPAPCELAAVGDRATCSCP